MFDSSQRATPPSSVLPLTPKNVASVFSAVDLTKKELREELGIPSEHPNDPSSAADWWMKNAKDRRWRRIIYELDRLGETEIADELMPYSEPPPGAWAVPNRIILAFSSVSRLCGRESKASSRSTRVIFAGSSVVDATLDSRFAICLTPTLL